MAHMTRVSVRGWVYATVSSVSDGSKGDGGGFECRTLSTVSNPIESGT